MRVRDLALGVFILVLGILGYIIIFTFPLLYGQPILPEFGYWMMVAASLFIAGGFALTIYGGVSKDTTK
jgi:hypothetical protein